MLSPSGARRSMMVARRSSSRLQAMSMSSPSAISPIPRNTVDMDADSGGWGSAAAAAVGAGSGPIALRTRTRSASTTLHRSRSDESKESVPIPIPHHWEWSSPSTRSKRHITISSSSAPTSSHLSIIDADEQADRLMSLTSFMSSPPARNKRTRSSSTAYLHPQQLDLSDISVSIPAPPGHDMRLSRRRSSKRARETPRDGSSDLTESNIMERDGPRAKRHSSVSSSGIMYHMDTPFIWAPEGAVQLRKSPFLGPSPASTSAMLSSPLGRTRSSTNSLRAVCVQCYEPGCSGQHYDDDIGFDERHAQDDHTNNT